jgi:hypothetical protein
MVHNWSPREEQFKIFLLFCRVKDREQQRQFLFPGQGAPEERRRIEKALPVDRY